MYSRPPEPNKNKSYIREWTELKRKELEQSDDINLENLFAGLMYGVVSFGKDDPRRKKDEKLQALGLDITKHYSGDASLFELGCYLYFRVDVWLFKNKPNLREKISTTFIREYNKLFAEALGLRDLSERFAERIDKYGELIRKGEDIERYHFYLAQLILKTKDNAPPQKYDFDRMPLSLSFFEDTGVKMELISWEKAMIPVILESLNKYCTLLEKIS